MNGRVVVQLNVAPRGRKVHGQALTEFIVLALALVPLFLLIPVIAKYQDIAHVVQMASRYIAFEAITRNGTASTWKPSGQLAQEVRRRFFSNPNAPIKTTDAAGNFKAHQNLFWRNQSGDAYGKPTIVGTVDMEKYSKWLEKTIASSFIEKYIFSICMERKIPKIFPTTQCIAKTKSE